MNQLVISALQKGGIHRKNRHHTASRQAAGKSDRVLLRNTYIKKTLGIFAGKTG